MFGLLEPLKPIQKLRLVWFFLTRTKAKVMILLDVGLALHSLA